MNAPYDVRQKYRNAMFDMMTTKNNTKKFLTELQDYYGCKMRTLPERLRTKLDEFIGMEGKREEERVLVDSPLGTVLSKAATKVEDTDVEISERYQRMKMLLLQADLIEKMEAFGMFSKRRKVAELQVENEMLTKVAASLTKVSTTSTPAPSSTHKF